MNSKTYKELKDFFKLFLNMAGIDIGFIFLQQIQEKNDLKTLISVIKNKQKSIKDKITTVGKKWMRDCCSEQEQSDGKPMLSIFDVDCPEISSYNFRLMCTTIEYSEEERGYFFWGFKKSKEIDINKTSNLCGVFGKLIIAYFEQEVNFHINKNTKNFLEYIINNSPDQIFIKDQNFRYVFSNKSHCQAHGLKRSDILGKSTYDLGFSKEQIEGDPHKGIRGFLRDDKDAIAGNVIRNRFDPVTISDGSIRIHDTYKIPFRENDKIVGVLGYARDITDWHDYLL